MRVSITAVESDSQIPRVWLVTDESTQARGRTCAVTMDV